MAPDPREMSNDNGYDMEHSETSKMWLYRIFLKDKMRCRERYRRGVSSVDVFHVLKMPQLESNRSSPRSSVVMIVPDGFFLRKYMPWIEEVVTRSSSNNKKGDATCWLRWILLESAVEYIEYRSASPTVPFVASDGPQPSTLYFPEAVTPNERSRCNNMVESGRSKIGPVSTPPPVMVCPVPDLSWVVGEEEEEEQKGDATAETFHAPQHLSVQDRSRLSFLRAGRWLSDGCGRRDQASSSHVILLTEDGTVATHLPPTPDEETPIAVPVMKAMSGPELLEFLMAHDALSDDSLQPLLAFFHRCDEEYRRRNLLKQRQALGLTSPDELGQAERTGHQPYLSETDVREGVRRGTLYKGTLDVSKANPREGYVVVTPAGGGDKRKVFLDNDLGNFNRAIHGDRVVVEMLPEELWGRPVGRRRLVHYSQNQEPGEEVASPPSLSNDDGGGGPSMPSGRVVALASAVERRRRFVATVQPRLAEEKSVLVIPMDIRIPKIRLPRSRLASQELGGKRLLVEMDSWEIGSTYPNGHYVKVIGESNDMETEIQCLLLENDIAFAPFSARAIASLPSSDWMLSEEEVAQRRDLRTSRRIFSVDPPGCQDIDDTMHVRRLATGDIEVGVHIADVTHFVRQGSALDKEATVRSTTFYLVDRRFDMLPSILSSDLCSLHEKVDRLAVSVIWIMTPDFKREKKCWFGRTAIRSCAAMTYEQAHRILQGDDPDDPTTPPPPPLTAGGRVDRDLIPDLKEDLSLLTSFARFLRGQREEIGGAVDLSSGDRGSELKFTLDENGKPKKVTPKTEMEIHHTIAELMILANQSVAKKIHEKFPSTALLRIHRPVDDDRFEELQEAMRAGGLAFDGRSNKALAKSLREAKENSKDSGAMDSLFKSLATRAMSEAQYICTGSKEASAGLMHYGLGINKYTHFTSPIRRFADVVVHRLLLKALQVADDEVPPLQVPAATPSHFIPESIAPSVLHGEVGAATNLGDFPEPEAPTDAEADRQLDDLLGSDFPSLELEGDALLDALIDGATDTLGIVAPEPEVDDIMAKEPPTGADLIVSTTTNEVSIGAPHQEHAGTDASEEAIDGDENNEAEGVYESGQVTTICDRLNHQTRVAKISSMDCQRLFLSLYFKNNTQLATALIVGLRANGIIVYVPKYDLKGAVFISDLKGVVQISPFILGLAANAGLPAQQGFAALEGCRMFSDGVSELVDESADEAKRELIVRVPGAPIIPVFKLLDVVTVQLSYDPSESVARVPPPRLHLYAIGPRKGESGEEKTKKEQAPATVAPTVAKKGKATMKRFEPISRSVYDIISSCKTTPIVPKAPMTLAYQAKPCTVQSKVPGRLVFGGFINLDASLQQQIAAAGQAGHGEVTSSIKTEKVSNATPGYDESRRLEREATTRLQRLEQQKFKSRRAKAGHFG